MRSQQTEMVRITYQFVHSHIPVDVGARHTAQNVGGWRLGSVNDCGEREGEPNEEAEVHFDGHHGCEGHEPDRLRGEMLRYNSGFLTTVQLSAVPEFCHCRLRVLFNVTL